MSRFQNPALVGKVAVFGLLGFSVVGGGIVMHVITQTVSQAEYERVWWLAVIILLLLVIAKQRRDQHKRRVPLVRVSRNGQYLVTPWPMLLGKQGREVTEELIRFGQLLGIPHDRQERARLLTEGGVLFNGENIRHSVCQIRKVKEYDVFDIIFQVGK